MEKRFKETTIPEDFSKTLANQSFLIGPSNADKIANVLFDGVSHVLSSAKSTTIPKAVIFRSVDHTFLAGAKVQFIPNNNDPDPSKGRWDYVWSFYEDDMKDADCIEALSNSLVTGAMETSGHNLYNMRFASSSLSIVMGVVMLEMIIAWLKENVGEEPATLVLDGVFTATASIEDDEVVMGIIPSGEMKQIIKDDSVIQEK